jgi:hypothetical protein
VANDPTVVVSDTEARAIRDEDLPVYTVLVPAYQAWSDLGTQGPTWARRVAVYPGAGPWSYGWTVWAVTPAP